MAFRLPDPIKPKKGLVDVLAQRDAAQQQAGLFPANYAPPAAMGSPATPQADPQQLAALLMALGTNRDAGARKGLARARSGGSESSGGRSGRAAGRSGRIIGTPHKGTHTLGNWQSDNAIDISLKRGTPILATHDGRVTKLSVRPEGGRISGSSITLNNNVFYTHLSRVKVRPGQRVKRGQVIGYSGVANGVPHLHLGVRGGDPRRYA